MYGYPGGIQVKDVVENQEKSLSEQIDDVLEMIEQNVCEMGKLLNQLELLLEEEA